MSNVEINVHVPEERLAEFYRTYAAFLEADAAEARDEHAASSHSSGSPREQRAQRSSSYAPLGDYLTRQRKSIVTLEFSEIESILSRSLPASAYQHRAWWANTPSHSQAANWLQQGWEASNLDLAAQTVAFKRIAS